MSRCAGTHLERASADGEVAYYNSGSWCEQPCVYLTVLDGRVEVQHFSQEPRLLEVDVA
jgi:hypothetical protein